MFHIKKNLKELYGIKRYSLGCWGKGLCTKGAQWWQTPSESTWKSRLWICRLRWKPSLSPDLPGTGLWQKGPSVRGEARGSLGPFAVCPAVFFFFLLELNPGLGVLPASHSAPLALWFSNAGKVWVAPMWRWHQVCFSTWKWKPLEGYTFSTRLWDLHTFGQCYSLGNSDFLPWIDYPLWRLC